MSHASPSPSACIRQDTCHAVHLGVDQRAQRMEQRLDGHDAQLKELSLISAQLTTLMDGQLRRLDKLENNGAGLPSKPSFWATEPGRLIIKGAFILLATLLAAAVGGNVLAAAVKAVTAL